MQEVGSCAGADLCAELAGAIDTSFTRTYEGRPGSRVVHRTQDVSVMADISPLAHGHLLMLPRKHYLSFGYAMPHVHEQVRRVLEELIPQYERTFGSATILEHGSSTDMASSACISHAHWHLVPVSGNAVVDLLARDGLVPLVLDDFSELSQFSATDSPYYYCAFDSQHLAYEVRPELPRQYLRLVVGQALGIAEPLHDYALVVRKHLLRETIHRTNGWLFGGA